MLTSKVSLLKRVPTGISKLDQIIGGGFIEGRTYLIAGETGTGKTIFGLQYLVFGAVALGESGIYVVVDEDADAIIEGARSLGWDLQPLIKGGKLSIMTLLGQFPEKFKGKYMDAIVKSIVRDIKEEAERINAKRLVIDPIAPFILEEGALSIMREYVRLLIRELERKVKCTTIVTSEIPTGTKSLSRYGVEEFLSSGVIVLSLIKELGKYVRIMYIRKMRWTPLKPSEYVFDIVPGKGIVILGPH